MHIRNYDKEDKTSVQAIFTQYWTDKEFLAELDSNLDGDQTRFFVAEKDGEVVGVAGFRRVPEHLRTHAETENPAELYIIASKLKNEGIGSMLVGKIIEEAGGSGFTEIECYSPETHESSWKFYEKIGFIKHGIINDPEDEYPGTLWKKKI